jgi:hypothetical protein
VAAEHGCFQGERRCAGRAPKLLEVLRSRYAVGVLMDCRSARRLSHKPMAVSGTHN